ncbi:hypothetical protein S7711_02867 [Stachybotrys chartarum IBT 7711]|uniref:Uncharacterized protein n=1 Tax=Stachybotrys chartarum (strain CBS 109288 / IBT 7711) TaxID=1280523 RepID=A0A084AH88_STACB|nr:hypothetical protein S7711_02867 [Stachybotrys chartarum IBT 7711]
MVLHITEVLDAAASLPNPDYTTPKTHHANGVNGVNGTKSNGINGVGLDGVNGTSGIDGAAHSEEDPICVVGMACRLPGDIRSPSQLWDFLVKKRSAQGRVPTNRFNISAFYHPDGSRAGVMDADGGYFLNEDVRQFDNGFFSINNMEATYMDPQQRKLLEVVYECFESAGVSMEAISGTDTGVYVGNFTLDYQTMQTRDPDYLHRYNATGSGTAIMSNRISHVFNLQGPSLTLDTACSSSIYCLHNAVSAIKAGECDRAIVAGANLITSPEQHVGTMKGGVLSPTSTCHTFDASADGYGRAEAVNAVYLKRLSAAIKDGDKVWSVIRGTAINSNGRTPGITQPSAKWQAAVVRKAYKTAGLSFDETDYIECHGTGTAVGDPIEVDGLQSCFGPSREWPLKIGSVKSNLGHSEAASGLTSLIKVSLALDNGLIPPTYGVTKLNPKLQLNKANMVIANDVAPWPREIRRASLNSFGYGGANAHAILESLESYLHQKPRDAIAHPVSLDQALVIPVSAGSAKSTDARLKQVESIIKNSDAETVASLAYTLAEHRPTLRNKSFLIAKAKSNGSVELVAPEPAEAVDASKANLPFAFVFTGQGAQYAEMGRALLQKNANFLGVIRELDTVLKSLPAKTAPTWTLEQAILDSPEVSQVNHVTRSQPLCTAIQIGLVSTLKSWGIEPTRVVGHSSGEIAAAYGAGLLSAKEAILAAYFRGYAVDKLTSKGTMVAAGVGPDVADQLIDEKGLRGQICVACVNSPSSVTLSGTEEAADILVEVLQERKALAKKLVTGGRAYHSHLVAEVGELYENLLSEHLDYSSEPFNAQSGVDMFSSVGYAKGQSILSATQARKARYWRDNLEKSVQFSSALTKLISGGKYHIIEVGPHPALKSPIGQIVTASGLAKNALPYSATLVRDQDAEVSIAKLAGGLYLHGHALQWANVNALPQASKVVSRSLGPYPWDYSAGVLWSEPRPSIELRNRKYARHELLGVAQLAGNGIDWSWRNVLRVGEAPWLSDHKVEAQTVFPAVGYLAMAMEAATQARELKFQQPTSFEFRNVSIIAALVVETETDTRPLDVELHTTLSYKKISTTRPSSDWLDFTVSSWIDGQTTLHASGSIRVAGQLKGPVSIEVQNAEDFDVWGMDRWYKKLADGGLCFGPAFQSLTSLRTDGNRVRTDAMASTRLTTRVGKETDTVYPIHPIAVDACLQAAIMGGTAGNLSTLKAFLPVFISEARIQAVAPVTNEDAIIHTRSTKTGFATRRIDCTLLDASGKSVIDIKGMRLALYSGKMEETVANSNLFLQRHPTLRVNWKPDVLRVVPGLEKQLDAYIDAFIERIEQKHADLADDEAQAVFAALLDLVGHNNPRMRVLSLTGDGQVQNKDWLSVLDKDTAMPRCRSWNSVAFSELGKLTADDASETFDAIVIPKLSDARALDEELARKIGSLAEESGVVIIRKTDAALAGLKSVGFTPIFFRRQIVLAVREVQQKPLDGKDVLIVVKDRVTPFADSLKTFLEKSSGAAEVKIAKISDLTKESVKPETAAISLLEVEGEFLATISPEHMDRLRIITDAVTRLVWVTGANMLSSSPDPNLTLSSGLSRALMLEQPSLRFSVLDIGPTKNLDLATTADNLVRVLCTFDEIDDKEFIQVDGVLYTSRFGPAMEINRDFRRRMGEEDPIEQVPLSLAGKAKLQVGKPGVTDSLYFLQVNDGDVKPPSGFIDVEVKAVSLNAKDIYVTSGHVETLNATSALEFAGIVKATGSDVDHVKVGDRVVVMAPNHFSTIERVPAWAAQKLLPTESFAEVSTLPIVYSTALYALDDRANLRAGESILIHAGAGAFGIAAIALAQRIGAKVYATVGSAAKKEFLINELGVPAGNIFASRDSTFVDGIKAATMGRGVDVVINSLVGDLMHASWEVLSKFGRFVEIGKKELTDAGKLEMSTFLNATTFTAFDLSELFYSEDEHYRNIWIQKLKTTLELYRAGEIKAGPIATYDVSKISDAYRYFSTRDRVGKVVISLENPNSTIPVAPSKYLSILDPNKVYLMIGCLGGLGRSLSRWMFARGARNFVFLGRSGCDKPSAKQLVTLLEKEGARVTVTRGDVSSADHVKLAVQDCLRTGKKIGGVIQAAMGLHEALWSTMPNSAWHTGIQPKWKGTWNIHNALDGHEDELDFFLLTSSVSGSVATATESNYCSANGFLDTFARWRRTQGKKAVSVGLGMISEVGYLHENPEIEALLLRKGIQPLTEDEFLQVIDLALSGSGGEYESKKPSVDGAHLLTGLESTGLRKLMASGWDVTSGNTQDPRSSVLSAALLAEQDSNERGESGGSGASANAPEWVKSLPKAVGKAFAAEYEAASLQEAVLNIIRKRFSSLILMPADQIDNTKPLAQFGMDSMIAAEFRTWIWGTFKVDVPFLDLLSNQNTLTLLSSSVEGKLVA